jgi:predicted ribosomally synthesized peptide with nif11-like leader
MPTWIALDLDKLSINNNKTRDKIMSQEKLQAFAEAVTKSEELQKRFNSIQVEAVKSTAEKLAKLSESAGTPFTAEEYLKSVAESSEEMSAQQLQSVAGGVWEPSAGNILASIFTAGFFCAVKAVASWTAKGDTDKCQF